MSGELLREAAAKMRKRAEAAVAWSGSSDWFADEDKVRSSGGMVCQSADLEARHIASWHPAVALAVADWLDHAAARAESKIEHGGKPEPAWSHERDALAVARAYLGRES